VPQTKHDASAFHRVLQFAFNRSNNIAVDLTAWTNPTIDALNQVESERVIGTWLRPAWLPLRRPSSRLRWLSTVPVLTQTYHPARPLVLCLRPPLSDILPQMERFVASFDRTAAYGALTSVERDRWLFFADVLSEWVRVGWQLALESRRGTKPATSTH
jgi:hypothetical protein